MRRGTVFPLNGMTTFCSRCTNGPLANATMYEDMGGVVWNRVIFHLCSLGSDDSILLISGVSLLAELPGS